MELREVNRELIGRLTETDAGGFDVGFLQRPIAKNASCRVSGGAARI
jgi:hypothetical protein